MNKTILNNFGLLHLHDRTEFSFHSIPCNTAAFCLVSIHHLVDCIFYTVVYLHFKQSYVVLSYCIAMYCTMVLKKWSSCQHIPVKQRNENKNPLDLKSTNVTSPIIQKSNSLNLGESWGTINVHKKVQPPKMSPEVQLQSLNEC